MGNNLEKEIFNRLKSKLHETISLAEFDSSIDKVVLGCMYKFIQQFVIYVTEYIDAPEGNTVIDLGFQAEKSLRKVANEIAFDRLQNISEKKH